MNLMPFDPMATYYLWFLKWREHVRSAKSCEINDAFCCAAVLCQKEYVIHMAIETVRLRKAGVIKDEQ